jgi:hypothetical protein
MFHLGKLECGHFRCLLLCRNSNLTNLIALIVNSETLSHNRLGGATNTSFNKVLSG